MSNPNLSNPEYVSTQYRTATNLNTRIDLHQRYSLNPYGWFPWLFDRLHFPDGSAILELGCGAGNLWLVNRARLVPGWRLTLSDFSPGMLGQARQNLATVYPINFSVIDAQAIPFESNRFEVVIANHMLYHVPDRPAALAEIRRVLKPGGRFYTSTIGMHHLAEIAELVKRFDANLQWWGVQMNAFTIENGAEQLLPWFQNIQVDRYEDALLVTESQALVDYLVSGRLGVSIERLPDFTRFVQSEFNQRQGSFYITKASGLLSADKP